MTAKAEPQTAAPVQERETITLYADEVMVVSSDPGIESSKVEYTMKSPGFLLSRAFTFLAMRNRRHFNQTGEDGAVKALLVLSPGKYRDWRR
jgi:hypothetical protein